MYKSIFVIVLLFSFISKINANPLLSFVEGVQSFLNSPSCTERGGIKLDEPFIGGRYCATGMDYRDCRCGDQCILSGQWCCNGEVCDEDQFDIVNSNPMNTDGLYDVVTVDAHPFFFNKMQSVFYRASCTERGGIELNQPFNGFNCGMGKSYRSCRCGNQCIISRQFCCDGIICDEEIFHNFSSYALAFMPNENFTDDLEYEIRICAYYKDNCEFNGICDRKKLESCVEFRSTLKPSYIPVEFVDEARLYNVVNYITK